MLALQDDVVSLVRLAKVGNQEAFADLVLLHENELCGYLASLLRDRNEAQDCAQQTFFKVWQKLSTLNDEVSFRSWLYIIARNVAYDHLRRKRNILLQSWEDLEAYSNSESAPQLEAHTILAELINQTFAELPPKLQICLRLDVCGYSHCEIAQALRISTSSVGTYLSTARKQFRQLYSRLKHDVECYPLVS